MARDRREDEGSFYPGGTVIPVPGHHSGRMGSWDDIANKPDVFPPEEHTHAIADVTGLETSLTKAVSDAAEAKAAVIMKRDATDNQCHATTTVDEWTFTGGIHVGATYTVQIKSEGAGVLRKWYAWLYVNNFYAAKTEIANADVTSVDWDNREGGVIHGERKVTTYAKDGEYYLTKTYTDGLLDGIDEKLKKIDDKRDKTDGAEYAEVPVQRRWQHDPTGNAELDAFLDSRPLGGLVFAMESETTGYWVIDEADGWLTQLPGTLAVDSVDERLEVNNVSSPDDLFTVHFYRESAYDGTRPEPTGDVMAARAAGVAPGVAKFNAAGKLVVATPSSPIEPGDYRAPTDNTCHKDELGEWAKPDGPIVVYGVERTFNNNKPRYFGNTWEWLDDTDCSWWGPGNETAVEGTFQCDDDVTIEFNSTRRIVAKSGETYVTPSGVKETYVVTDAVDGGVSVKINGKTVTAFADLLAKCKTGRAVLYGQATTVETGYAFYAAASVTASVIQFQVSGMLYDKSNIRYGMYVRRIKIVPRATGGLLVDDSGLEGPFAKKSDIPTDEEITGIAEDAVAAKLPYALVTVDGTHPIADRAINTIADGGTDGAALTLPAAFSDLIFRTTGKVASLSFAGTGVTSAFGDDLPTEGNNLITVTRITAATAFVRVVKLEDHTYGN